MGPQEKNNEPLGFSHLIQAAHKLPEAHPVQDVLAGQLDPGATILRIALLVEANGARRTHLSDTVAVSSNTAS